MRALFLLALVVLACDEHVTGVCVTPPPPDAAAAADVGTGTAARDAGADVALERPGPDASGGVDAAPCVPLPPSPNDRVHVYACTEIGDGGALVPSTTRAICAVSIDRGLSTTRATGCGWGGYLCVAECP